MLVENLLPTDRVALDVETEEARPRTLASFAEGELEAAWMPAERCRVLRRRPERRQQLL
jgi:hypothetical protein